MTHAHRLSGIRGLASSPLLALVILPGAGFHHSRRC